MEAPEPEIKENKTPSKRARNETTLAGSVSRRTRSKREHGVGSSKKYKSKSSVIVLHDSPVRNTSLALTTPTVGTVRPSSVSTAGVVPSLSPDFETKKYKRKTIAHKMKTVGPDVGSSFDKVNT